MDWPAIAERVRGEVLAMLAAPPVPQGRTVSPTPAGLARSIDHTLLKAESSRAEVLVLCAEAIAHQFASVCVNPARVSLAAGALAGTEVMVCTVVGFPLGATTSAAKAFETRQALGDGADEIDMVLAIGAMRDGDLATVIADIAAVVEAAAGHTVKVILETCYLSDEQKALACGLAKAAGASFVKTSTGFGPAGATEADVALMRRIVGPDMGVKASGGIRDTGTALAMVAAGASRLGTSASVAIIGAGGVGAAGY